MKKINFEVLLYPIIILISTLAITYYISLFCLFFKLNNPKYTLIYAYIIALFSIKILFTKSSFLDLIVSSFFVVSICIVSYFAVINIYDLSWDGQWYHQDAIIKLYKGWNPIYSVSTTNNVGSSELWINHYTQGIWIIEANILRLTERIQSAKVLTLVLVLITILNSIYVFQKYKLSKNIFISILFSIAIVLNPIAISQIFSFYVDGISALMVTNIIMLLYIYFKENHSKSILVILLFIISIYINVKFSNLVYISIILFGYFLILLYTKRKIDFNYIFSFSIIYLFSAVIIGYSSYTKNTIEKGHPFYPLMGEGSYSGLISRIQKPANFDSTNNRLDNFIIGNLFAFPQYSRSPFEYKVRLPFTPTTYFQYFSTDAEIAGFGAIYFDILIVLFTCIIFSMLYLYKKRRELYILNKNKLIVGIIIVVTLFSSCLINDGMHVSRYIPQFYLIPFILLIFTYKIDGRFFKILTVLILTAFMVNSYYILERQITYYKDMSRHVIFEMQYLNEQYKYVEVEMEYESVERRLIENNVKYIKKDLTSDSLKNPFLFTGERNFYKGIK